MLERDPAARLGLLVAIRRLGPIDEPAPPALLAALDDPSRIVRIEALQAIAEFTSGVDRAVPVLLSDAESAPAEPRFQDWPHVFPLRQAAERLQPTAAVIPRLIEGLESLNPDVREVAVVLLKRLGPAARPATRGLDHRDQVHDPVCQARTRAGRRPFFLRLRVGPDPDRARRSSNCGLERSARPRPSHGRAHAAWFLGTLGPQGGAAVPILLKALKDAGDPPLGRASEEYAQAILRSLWDIAAGAMLPKPMADEVVEVFSRSLDHPQSFIRKTAADALGDFGSKAARALPRLRALSEDAQAPRDVREAAARAVDRIELETEDDDAGPAA